AGRGESREVEGRADVGQLDEALHRIARQLARYRDTALAAIDHLDRAVRRLIGTLEQTERERSGRLRSLAAFALRMRERREPDRRPPMDAQLRAGARDERIGDGDRARVDLH